MRSTKVRPAYEAKKIVLRNFFWKKANDLIKDYKPLVKVLRLVDGDKKPTTNFIYEAVNKAKRAIQQDCRYFTEYKKIIDNRWNFMHSNLHLAEILEGTRAVIEILEPSLDTQVRMVNQLLLFRNKYEIFDTPQAQRAWKQMNP
ncbi:hypothetical protein Gohar_028149, partial [Gossypium harknessii]|nr:hypothetical protein [Gossypium harknessii]